MFKSKKETTEELTAALAHEVKNPVSVIRANIDFMQANDNTKLFEKNYIVIKKELDKIYDIIMDFINLSRPVNKENIEKIFIFDLISDIIDDYKITLNNKKIEFLLNCKDEEVCINAEHSKICILFFNIYKNAVESIKNNGIIITNINYNNENVIIEIIDDGIGIDKDIIDKIGTPFFTTKNEGSGLGISICTNIVNSYNGSFEIINNKIKGCKVIVIFPKGKGD